mmetsp:Transcript_24330/g.58613  ORF Transcript_24330/g.58613 Transcript_24330/m.58613 type:complete len:142 (+) Transcript_24330:189-614(+)
MIRALDRQVLRKIVQEGSAYGARGMEEPDESWCHDAIEAVLLRVVPILKELVYPCFSSSFGLGSALCSEHVLHLVVRSIDDKVVDIGKGLLKQHTVSIVIPNTLTPLSDVSRRAIRFENAVSVELLHVVGESRQIIARHKL